MGVLWDRMDAQRRRSVAALTSADIPEPPGVYALYRDGERMYVGKADCLRDRVWKNHSGRGMSMSNSAMRRNVAEHLGIATPADIKSGLHRVTVEEAKRVRDWLDSCDIAWVECESKQAAKDLETAMKREHKPPLTKQ